MKTLFLYSIYFVFFLAGAPAHAGPRTIGNGGDPLEIKFKEVASNIREWIESGNADQLHLPAGLRLDSYKTAMVKALSAYDIELTTRRLLIGGSEKTCANSRAAGEKSKVRCNIRRFRETLEADPDDLYRLIHHEFAGLAGLEKSTGAESDYRLSEQLSSYLVIEVIKRLPVARVSNHHFSCEAVLGDELGGPSVQLKPISESETYMLEGKILNLYFATYLWETKTGFDLQVSKAPYIFDSSKTQSFNDVMNDLTMIFKAGPSFETNMDGSKIGSAYLMHFLDPKLEPRATQTSVTVTCKY